MLKLAVAVLVLVQILGSSARSVPRKPCDYCSEELELGIVLDSSSSISREDFASAKAFLQEYLKNFDIQQQAVRVSLITYGRTVHPEDSFNLTTYNSNEEVNEALDNLPHHATTFTSTNEGIRFMRTQQLRDDLVRPGIQKVGLVITDGNSQEKEKTAAEARKSLQDGIVMFAIGVGGRVDDAELLRIAGDPDRVDLVNSYNKLQTITKWLVDETCVPKKCGGKKEETAARPGRTVF